MVLSKELSLETETVWGGVGPSWTDICMDEDNGFDDEVFAIFENMRPTGPETPTERLGLKS